MKPTSDNIVDFIRWLFDKRGSESYLGEQVTMAEHMLQAAHFAKQDGVSEALIVAALLHDVGHFTGDFGDDFIAQGVDNLHEDAGGAVLSPFFPEAVTEPIRLHVAAKKYLCATAPDYYETLSDASKRTLELQGGAMTDEERCAFESHPHFEAAVRLRRWDDAGKVPALSVAGLSDYLGMINRVCKTPPANKAGA